MGFELRNYVCLIYKTTLLIKLKILYLSITIDPDFNVKKNKHSGYHHWPD